MLAVQMPFEKSDHNKSVKFESTSRKFPKGKVCCLGSKFHQFLPNKFNSSALLPQKCVKVEFVTLGAEALKAFSYSVAVQIQPILAQSHLHLY